jgi:hypothetical protein
MHDSRESPYVDHDGLDPRQSVDQAAPAASTDGLDTKRGIDRRSGPQPGRASLPPIVVALNPVVVTVLVIVGMLAGDSERLAAFVVPAAPNLAHGVFFIGGAMRAGSIGRKASA